MVCDCSGPASARGRLSSLSSAVEFEMLRGNTLCSADFSMTFCNQLSI